MVLVKPLLKCHITLCPAPWHHHTHDMPLKHEPLEGENCVSWLSLCSQWLPGCLYMKLCHDPLVTRKAHYCISILCCTSKYCLHLARRMESVASIIGKGTADLNLSCCWEWNQKPEQQVSPDTILVTSGCMITLIIGHRKDMITENTSKLIQITVIISNKGEAWEKLRLTQWRFFGCNYQNPTPTLGHLSKKGPIGMIFINISTGTIHILSLFPLSFPHFTSPSVSSYSFFDSF